MSTSRLRFVLHGVYATRMTVASERFDRFAAGTPPAAKGMRSPGACLRKIFRTQILPARFARVERKSPFAPGRGDGLDTLLRSSVN